MKLTDIIETAGNATSQPEEPKGGIPKQKLPSFIRWFFRILLLPFLYLEMSAEKIASLIVPPPFKQVGACKRRGNCCYYVLLPDVKGFLGKFLFFWHTEIFGFYPRTKEPHEYEGKKIHVMGCRYLRKNGSCSRYFFRPKVCRSWPVIRIFGIPRILKGCGYQAKVKPSYAKKYPQLNVLNNSEKE
jgi:hypothetical protein